MHCFFPSKYKKGYYVVLIFLVNMRRFFFLWKTKKGVTVTNAFQNILGKSNPKPNMESWLQDNYIEIHSTHSEEKFIVAERFIRTLWNKIYKYNAANKSF